MMVYMGYVLFFFMRMCYVWFFFFFQAEDGIRDVAVTGVQTCALPISGEAEDFLYFFPHLAPHVGIQVAERLVQEQDDGFGGERAGERHPLLLAAGELVRVAVLEARESNEVQRLSDHVHGSRLLRSEERRVGK